LNDVTPLDSRRDLLGIVVLLVLLIIIIPAPKVLIAALGL
jgi:hypothetical protein